MDEMTLDEFRRKYLGLKRGRRRGGSSKGHGDVVATLLFQIRATGLPEPESEYRFHPDRRWRFDLAWPAAMVACEVEGGIWMQTDTGRGKGHAHPERFTGDCEKYSEAAICGWRLIRATPEQVVSGQALSWLRQILGGIRDD